MRVLTGLVALMLVTTIVLGAPALATQSEETHTLVIEQIDGSVSYTVTVSGSITLYSTESGDAVSGDTVTGRVGGYPWSETANDSRDVIQFAGELQNFEYSGGEVRLILDGKEIDPNSLISTPKWTPSPTPTKIPTATKTPTPTTTATQTQTPTPTATRTPTETETQIRTEELQPTDTVTDTDTETETQTRTPAPFRPFDNQFLVGMAGGLVLVLLSGVLAILYLNRR